MKLVKIKPNYRIYISKKTANSTNQNITSSFYTNLEPEKLLSNIDIALSKSENNGCKVFIKIYRINNKYGFFKEFEYEDKDIKEIKDDIMCSLHSIPGVIDFKNTRYQLTVTNKFSSELDVKNFSFNSKEKLDVVISSIKEEIDKKFVELGVGEIEFSNTNKSIITHYLTVLPVGSLARRTDSSSKSFGIYFPDHSSSEIIRILKGEKIEY